MPLDPPLERKAFQYLPVMLNYPSVPKIIETPANAVAEAEEECQVCI